MIRYTSSLDGIHTEMLEGFFVGWRSPRTPEEHLAILARSDLIVLAIDTETDRIVGFVTALTDGMQAAFVPLIEILPEFQGRGIGSELMRRMLDALGSIPCVDLTCDPELRPFYRKFGMIPSVGMILRRT
jgi:ribosomal protein S18 acetylase RimI-like enzyme